MRSDKVFMGYRWCAVLLLVLAFQQPASAVDLPGADDPALQAAAEGWLGVEGLAPVHEMARLAWEGNVAAQRTAIERKQYGVSAVTGEYGLRSGAFGSSDRRGSSKAVGVYFFPTIIVVVALDTVLLIPYSRPTLIP